MNAVIHHRAADRADEWQGLYGKQQHRKVMRILPQVTLARW
jgi:hypothetical protein